MTKQSMTTRHLTEDELEEVLLGLDCPRTENHLAECEGCRGKIDEFRGTLELFNRTSTAWFEAKSNSLNRDLGQREASIRMGVRPVWACVAMLVAVLAGAIGVGASRHAGAGAGTALRAGSSVDSSVGSSVDEASEIAGDNAMMRQIDSVISTPEPSPSQLYGRTSTASNGRDGNIAPVRN
jgi:predicted anti-sigma-YlaC factor YlaD